MSRFDESKDDDFKKDWLKVLDTNLPSIIWALAPGNYSPVHSFFGGIAAQEAVKYTGKFTPINNIFVHEFYTNLFKGKSLDSL